MNEKTVPHDYWAEQSVLGALLLRPEAITEVADFLAVEDFFKEKHRVIYAAMLALHQRSVPIDMVVLADELGNMGWLEKVGGHAALFKIRNDTPSASGEGLEYHADIVKEKSVRRKMIEAGGAIAALGFQEDGRADDLINKAASQVQQAGNGLGSKRRFVAMKKLGEEDSAEFDQAEENGEVLIGAQSGIPDIDRLTGGFRQGDLVILASRPGVGKTALTLNMALHMAEEGKRVGFIELEMPARQLYQRLIAIRGGIDGKRLSQVAYLSQEERKRRHQAKALIDSLPLFIEDSGATTIAGITDGATELKQRGGLDVLFVDYLQLVGGGHQSRGGSREQEVASISRGLKKLARALDVPLIACAQLSRSAEQHHKGRPRLSDLRESGAIEADADVIMFLHAEDGALRERGPIALHVDKHRNGPLGTCELIFIPSTMRFGGADYTHSFEQNSFGAKRRDWESNVL